METYPDQILRLYGSENSVARCRELTFQVTEDCCMACTYCYQNHKTHNKMTWETIKPFLDELLTDKNELINTKTSIGIVLDFIGGEPLLEIKLIDQICTYIWNYYIEHDHPWLLTTKINLCTNGLLYFNKDVQDFLNKFKRFCSVTFSIDGDKTLHDMCRKDLNGNGTYDRAIKAAIDYYNKNKQPFETKMTLSPDNIQYASKAIINLIQNNFVYISVNCIYEEGWTYGHSTILYYEFKKIADYILDNNLYDKVYIRIFDDNLYRPIDKNYTANWCGGISDTNLAVDYRGQLFTCIRYMESSLNNKQPALPIGDITTGYLSNMLYKKNYNLMKNITYQSQSSNKCLKCKIAAGCGWCSAYNYEKFGTPNKRATFICPMHQASSLINVYYWNKLYKKLNIPKIFKLYLKKKYIKKIILKQEYKVLKQLIKR